MYQLNWLLPPLLGSFVGYFTNSLAVKMLFRPYKPYYIGKHRLPMTPGMIPKRQPELSRAMGAMVQDNLLTSDEIQQRLLAPSVRDAIISEISAGFFTSDGDESLGEVLGMVEDSMGEEGLAERLTDTVTRAILQQLSQLDFEQLLRKHARSLLDESMGSLSVLFLGDDALDSLILTIVSRIDDLLGSSGYDLLRPQVARKASAILESKAGDLLSKTGISRENLEAVLAVLYERTVSGDLTGLFAAVDIAYVVESRVKSMDVRELEHLIISIMKRELNGIVNLGGFVGLLLGTLTLAF